MNRTPDVELVLRDYFADDGLTAPDYVLDVVEQRIGRQPQRRSWPFPGRTTTMTPLKLAAALAAAIVVAFVGYSLLPRQPGIGGPSIVPTPTPTAVAPSATPTSRPSATASACDDPAFSCAGILSPGEHSSTAFQPRLTFTVDNGWYNTLDRDRAYTLHDSFSPAHYFQVLSQTAIPEQNAECTAQAKAGAGSSVSDWVEFLTSHPGLVASAPSPISVGGYEGQRVDLHVADAWTVTCPNSLGPAVFLITDSGTPPERVRQIDDQYVTMRIVDVAGATVILYLESGPSDAQLSRVNTSLQPTIDTFRFAP